MRTFLLCTLPAESGRCAFYMSADVRRTAGVCAFAHLGRHAAERFGGEIQGPGPLSTGNAGGTCTKKKEEFFLPHKKAGAKQVFYIIGTKIAYYLGNYNKREYGYARKPVKEEN